MYLYSSKKKLIRVVTFFFPTLKLWFDRMTRKIWKSVDKRSKIYNITRGSGSLAKRHARKDEHLSDPKH